MCYLAGTGMDCPTAMNLDSPHLENEYVRLEVADEHHRAVVKNSNAVDSMWSWAPMLTAGTSFNSYFDGTMRLKEAGRLIPWIVFRQSDGSFCGITAYAEYSRTHRRVRIDYAWHPAELRGTIIGPATQLALLQRALECRIRRVEFVSSTENARSISSIERLGARREGIMRSYCRVASGEWADLILFSLIGTEIERATAFLKDRIQELHAA